MHLRILSAEQRDIEILYARDRLMLVTVPDGVVASL
jgi:hypothetical protein